MKTYLFSFVFICLSQIIFAQAGWEEADDHSTSMELNEGIYRNFDEFKKNTPFIQAEMESNLENIYIKDSSDQWIKVNADKVWGCVLNQKLYLAFEGRFWKSLNEGSLLYFAAIDYRTSVQGNVTFGINVSQEPVSVQLFLDTETGAVKNLNYRNLAPYLEKEPSIVQYIKKNKVNKAKQVALLLKLYNELHP